MIGSAYRHRTVEGELIDLPTGKAVCVGRNYADHARELDNPVPVEPVLFIKPSTTLCAFNQPLSIPVGRGSVHHELEIALLIGQPLVRADSRSAMQAVVGIGLALDLTLRDQQAELKRNGLPWERAKAFDGSCPLSPFLPVEQIEDWQLLSFDLMVNGELRQAGQIRHMLFPVHALLEEISNTFTLLPGDIVLTGTPAGVAPLTAGDQLSVRLHQQLELLFEANTQVMR